MAADLLVGSAGNVLDEARRGFVKAVGLKANGQHGPQSGSDGSTAREHALRPTTILLDNAGPTRRNASARRTAALNAGPYGQDPGTTSSSNKRPVPGRSNKLVYRPRVELGGPTGLDLCL